MLDGRPIKKQTWHSSVTDELINLTSSAADHRPERDAEDR
jgi:hypothetical protein